MRTNTPRLHLAAFDAGFSAIATLAPILLTVFAFAASPDSMQRAHMIVRGCELIVGILGGALALRGAYLFGLRNASALAHATPVRTGGMEMA